MTTKRKRQQSHIYWESNCAICFNLWQHDRMAAVYCSQKCRNRARSYPQKMLESLIRKSQQTLVSHKRITEHERIAITTLAGDSKDLMKLGSIVGLSVAEIKELSHNIDKIKAKRYLEAESKKLGTTYVSTDEDNHSSLIDSEMVDFKLPDTLDEEVKDNLKFINKTDPANGGSDGFVTSNDNIGEKQDDNTVNSTGCSNSSGDGGRGTTKQSPSKGLRRLGGK